MEHRDAYADTIVHWSLAQPDGVSAALKDDGPADAEVDLARGLVEAAAGLLRKLQAEIRAGKRGAYGLSREAG